MQVVHFNALVLKWKVDAFSRIIYAWKQTKFCCSSPLLIKNWIFYCLIFYFPFSGHIIHQLYPDNSPKINWWHQVGASRMGAPLEAAEAEELFFISPTRHNPNCPLLRGGVTKTDGYDHAPGHSRKQQWGQQWEWCFLSLVSQFFLSCHLFLRELLQPDALM